jgi:hypothetical protein
LAASLYLVGLAPLIFNLIRDIIDNKTIDALKNAGMNYAVIVVYIFLGTDLIWYTFFIVLLMFLFWIRPHALGEGDYTGLFWILPTLFLLSPWAPIIFLCLHLFGIYVTSRALQPPFEGYIPITAAYLVTGFFTIWGIIPK